ncbi:hypothetical protein H9Y04_36345 [Streptomyces sp. TRM66268-LWL]|uniref:Putative Flp pilus-assembly TadG-like N-terminal domain-containing protein n=1 Tax=Streptomyces polyasparticus TaxID=2767826 RepID=A0ABR7SUI2_9ACTN|nr:pilus assembly protein TadG-related protein [Streptomyces polyasparticus]MBC9718018.1 hypothetical protein [Streptomyces polyasparticus]
MSRRSRPEWDDAGQVSAMVVVMVAGLFLFAGLVLDGGLALAGKVRAADTAQEAARAACQAVDLEYLRSTQELRLDEPRARAAAQARVSAAGDSGTVHITADTATVEVTHRQPMQILSLIGISTLTTRAQASAHIERGTTTPWDEGAL